MKRTMLAAALVAFPVFTVASAYACPAGFTCYEGHPSWRGSSGVCSTWELDTYPGVEFSIIGNSTSDFAMIGMTDALRDAVDTPGKSVQLVSNGLTDQACQHANTGDTSVVGVRRAGLP